MKTDKYSNIDDAFPRLNSVLKNAIQSDVLDIKRVDKLCSKYLTLMQEHPHLGEAEFVVFSPYVRECDHPFEHFIFLDGSGRCICHVSGTELDLTGICEACTNLKMTGEYLKEHPQEHVSRLSES